MAFKDLYEAVQEIEGKISTRTLTELAKEHSEIKRVKEQWSGLVDADTLRGFYIEGPMGPPVPLAEHEALIVLSRAMVTAPSGPHWRHFVYTKELMHVFDLDEEKASDEQTFDVQIHKFGDPTKELSPQFKAEGKAFWRALMVLCRESQRQEYRERFRAGDVTLDMVAAAVRIPMAYAHHLVADNFDNIVAALVES